ncbi:MAG: UPF0280 family protein [Bacteroidaceae bacterium]|nr:UPF0280 family protein [Bacteroidaceae bacterium]
MEYKERSYRSRFSDNGRRWFCVRFLESDLWIGVDNGSYHASMEQEAYTALVELRRSMDAYLISDHLYKSALIPYDAGVEAPSILKYMSKVSHKTGIGPMSAVAGAVALYVAEFIKERFGVGEVIVENGGDIYADVREDMDIAVFAGESPLSERVGLHIPASAFPLGICTSSGTVGPSLSLGRADAVMIVCRDVLLADSYATAMANRIRTAADLQPVIDSIRTVPDILGALAVKDDRMAVCGQFELRLFRNDHHQGPLP